jgi:hypothetical protein
MAQSLRDGLKHHLPSLDMKSPYPGSQIPK